VKITKRVRTKSLAKGLVAGLVGGLVATAAKKTVERIYPPRTHGEPDPSSLLAERASHKLSIRQHPITKEAIHWGFGAATGAAYGAAVEYFPAAAGKDGANFGMALMTLTHEGAFPALGLSRHTSEQTIRERTSELTSHVVFGVVAETVRRVVRRVLR
jgi:putative membrane protein